MNYPVNSDMTEPKLQLYTFQLCPFAHRVRLALAEKGVAAEAIEIDLKSKPASFARTAPLAGSRCCCTERSNSGNGRHQ